MKYFIPILLLLWSCKTAPVYKTDADLAAEHEWLMTHDPQTLDIPKDRLWKATEELKLSDKNRKKVSISNVSWTERGPDNVGGRTRAIMFYPNSSKVLAAGVGGGLFVCEDIYATNPTWTSVDDYMANLAVTSLTYNPVSPDTMYLGTGEGFYNSDAIKGLGIFMSTDSGQSWSRLTSTASADFNYVNKVVSMGNGVVLAACRSDLTNKGGLLVSTDGGANWSRKLPSTQPYIAADIEIAANGDVYCTIGLRTTGGTDDGIWKSTDSGQTWTKVYNPATNDARIEIACAPSDYNYIYAIVERNNRVHRMMKSTDGGATWSNLQNVSWQDFCLFTASGDFSRSQAWYDLLLAVDPHDTATVYIGGIDIFKTSNGGQTWTQLTSWTGCGGYDYVHADQHIWLFHPNSSDSALIGNDGGIYLTKNAGNSFKHVVKGYNVTQFYGTVAHPDSGSLYFLAGAQDNGTQRFNSAGINSTVEVTGGDGAYCHIDEDQPQYQFTSYVYTNMFRSTNGATFSSWINNSNGLFINASDYDWQENNMYMGNATSIYARVSNAPSSSTLWYSNNLFSGKVSAVKVDDNVKHRVYFGTTNGNIYRVDSAHSNSPQVTSLHQTGMPFSYLSSIDVERGDSLHLLVTYSSYGVNSVWESRNGGQTWTSIEGNLPDMPIRWGVFSPVSSFQVFLATELGVWSTDNVNGSSTNWGATNDGLANVRTDMLRVRWSDSTLVAATHGRGLFTTNLSSVVAPQFYTDRFIVYAGDEVQFYDESTGATSWKWDFNNDGTIDATTKNPTYAYGTGGYKSATLIINNSDTLTKDSIVAVLPKLGTPYEAADGGNFESNTLLHFIEYSPSGTKIWERGVPSNALTTVNSGTKAWKTDLDADCPDATVLDYILTPSFNLTNSGTYTLSLRTSAENFYSTTPYGLYIEYSLDSSETWLKLGSYNDSNGTNWYNKNNIEGNVISDGVGWLGSWNNQLNQLDISSLSGNADVRFRIVYQSNSAWSTTGFLDGFMIDDFQILGDTNDPVPVQLISFTGQAIDGEAYLRWITASEVNSSHFEVQRLVGDNFQTIGTVKAAGTSFNILNYSFSNTMQDDIEYYRLKSVDFDGSFDLSQIVVIQNDKHVTKIIPNPAKTELTFVTTGKAYISVYNTDGKEVITALVVDNYTVDVSQLPEGVYYVRIKYSDYEFETKKVIIAR